MSTSSTNPTRPSRRSPLAARRSLVELLATLAVALGASQGALGWSGSDEVLFEDRFDTALGDGWTWVREDPEGWRVRDGALEIRVRPGNLWGGANNAGNLLVRPLPAEDLACEVTVSNEPTEQWEQAGIAWYRDDSNMVKLVKERVDGELWIVMGREEGDRTRTLAKVPLATASVRLRLEVRGRAVSGSYRPHGETAWRKAAECELPRGNGSHVILHVYNGPQNVEHWARFTDFRVLRLAGQSPAPLLVREQIGVNIHFTGAPERDMRMLAEAGFGWIRMDMVWEAIEREKGSYVFDRYDELVGGLTSHGIRALFILDYSNRLYETARSVRTDEGRAAFARFAAAAASRYRGKGVRWEIWNEPNHRTFWTPEPSAADYLALVRAAVPAIRAADPEARILAPATSGIPHDFLGALFEGGLLELVDEVSVHPYRGQPPETVTADYARLAELIRRHAPAGVAPRPVVSGEWGYSNWHWGKPISPETQAAYLARQFLTNIAAGVQLSIWYDWANDGEDPKNPEHNFGTVTAAREPKPAYLAVKTLAGALGAARFETRLESPEGTHVLMFLSGDGATRIVAAWRVEGEGKVRVAAPGLEGEVRALDVLGVASTFAAAGGELELPLGPGPLFLTIPRPQARGLRVTGSARH